MGAGKPALRPATSFSQKGPILQSAFDMLENIGLSQSNAPAEINLVLYSVSS